MSLTSSIVYTLILTVVIILVGLVTYRIVHKNMNKRVEAYASPPDDMELEDISSMVNNFLREYGFESIASLYDFVSGRYNEDFSPIMEDKTLTLYYSVFSIDSIPKEQSRRFNNISPYFKDIKDTSCKFLQYDNSYLEFIDSPYANRNLGIELLTNSAVGPPSHLLGMQGNGTFTVFMALRFNGFSVNNALDYEVFKMYGNTDKNNAVSLTIDALPRSRDINSAEVRFKLHYSSQNGIPTTYGGVDHFQIEYAKPYLIVVTKLNKKISMNIHDLSKDLSLDSTYKLIENVELEEPNAFFSNKAMTINAFDNLNANIFTFGTYNMYIMDESALHHYMYREMYKSSDAFLREARQILSFQKEINNTKACPYDATVCKACSEVKDWTRIGNGVVEASLECRQAIDAYCMENLNDPKCSCWRPANRTSVECQSYLNIFKSVALVDPDNLDDTTREKITSKYKLCDCGDLDALREEIKNLKQQNNNSSTNDHPHPHQNPFPPIHALTSPYLDSGPVQMQKDDKRGPYEMTPSLLSNLPKDVLPPVSPYRLQRLADAQMSYIGDDGDDANYNTRLERETDDDPHSSVLKSSEYRYGETDLQPGKGFWAWLFGK